MSEPLKARSEEVIDEEASEDEESSEDSEAEERSICRSPSKSPRKLSAALKRKRCASEDIEAADEASEEEAAPHVLVNKEPTDEDFQFKEPKFRKKKFIFHPFGKNSDGKFVPDPSSASVEVTIPEQLAASYGLYIWPSSPVLAWYLWLHQHQFTKPSRILELGAGTALPGLLLAKLGHRVTLSDSLLLPHCLDNCREAARCNGLEQQVEVVGLSWGLVTSGLLRMRGQLDWIIGSDLFFDPAVSEPLLVTVKWLLDSNPGAQFLCTVQERSADWSIEVLLRKYALSCSYEQPADFLAGTGIQEADLTGDHNIFLIRVTSVE
jgi:predicted nicotinamide N-methyase